jgi:hypothetical protein
MGVRTAVLLGVNEFTLSLADKLQSGHWKVRMIDLPGSNFDDVKQLNDKNVPKEHKVHLDASTNDVEMLPTITYVTLFKYISLNLYIVPPVHKLFILVRLNNITKKKKKRKKRKFGIFKLKN